MNTMVFEIMEYLLISLDKTNIADIIRSGLKACDR
jgi:hypothetical protein